MKICRIRITTKVAKTRKKSNFVTNFFIKNKLNKLKLYIYANALMANEAIIMYQVITWYIDIGATQHMCYKINSFINHQKCDSNQVVFLGNSTSCQIVGKGEGTIKLSNGMEKKIPNMLCVLGFKNNLFYVKQFDKFGGGIHIKSRLCTLKK
jgi:hypothetical protein